MNDSTTYVIQDSLAAKPVVFERNSDALSERENETKLELSSR